MALMICVIFIIGGYIVGSISPSFILGKILKNIDIRQHGTRNAGTINTYQVLGLWPAAITALFDLTKGILSMFIAHSLGASPLCAHLVGFAAILGHTFPFYLKFKGGQGVATATAIMIYYLVFFFSKGGLPVEILIPLAFAVGSFAYISKKEEIIGIVILPLLGIFIFVFAPLQTHHFFILSIIVYILIINILNVYRGQYLKPSSEKMKKEINWRLYLRPFAFLLVVYYMTTSRRDALVLIGSIALFFLFLDLVRLFSKRVNIFFFKTIKDFYKAKEYKKFSSITLFLFASFLAILLFNKNIAILAVSYLIFGDFFSKFFGLHFGRTRIFEKSLEGSLAHFNACIISGYIMLHFISAPLLIYLTGALVASVSEALPIGINDNFSVGLLSASSMYVFYLF
jgi:glycerol-3-phosphate acyltransferase PlsY